MEPTDWPLDRASTTALVLRTVVEIDTSSEEERDGLLGELLCTAWGSIWAQNQ